MFVSSKSTTKQLEIIESGVVSIIRQVRRYVGRNTAHAVDASRFPWRESTPAHSVAGHHGAVAAPEVRVRGAGLVAAFRHLDAQPARHEEVVVTTVTKWCPFAPPDPSVTTPL